MGQDRRCHSGKGPLAVGARNMDALKLLFRVSKVVQQCPHTLQGCAAAGQARQGVQGFNRLLFCHKYLSYLGFRGGHPLC